MGFRVVQYILARVGSKITSIKLMGFTSETTSATCSLIDLFKILDQTFIFQQLSKLQSIVTILRKTLLGERRMQHISCQVRKIISSRQTFVVQQVVFLSGQLGNESGVVLCGVDQLPFDISQETSRFVAHFLSVGR